MINIFKQKVLKLYCNYLLRQKKNRVNNINFKNSNFLGVIYKYDSLCQDIIIHFITQLKKTNKNIKVICYIDSKNKDFNYQYHSFNKKDITLLGKIIDKDLKNFVEAKFDFLFFLDFKIDPFLEYVLIKSNTKCKLGFYNKSLEPVLDLMVNFKREYEPYIDMENLNICNKKKEIKPNLENFSNKTDDLKLDKYTNILSNSLIEASNTKDKSIDLSYSDLIMKDKANLIDQILNYVNTI